MPRPVHELHFDFETFCELDLKKVGIYRYVEHRSFKLLCVAWKIDGRQTIGVCIDRNAQSLPPDLEDALRNRNVQGHAHNAAFETAVLTRFNVFPVHPISCTMQRALAYGLPAKLEHAAAALGLEHQKDMQGHRLMLRMSRPQKPGAEPWNINDQLTLAVYCAKDVEAEAALSAVIPELQPEERELSLLDARMNSSGELGIDFARVSELGVVAATAETEDAERCAQLTEGAVTSPGTQTTRLLAWLTDQGIPLSDLGRATVEEALPDISPGGVHEVLEIRLRAARASTRKLVRMLQMADLKTQALHGQFQFCGAGRTGRWSGRGVQVQNLPRVPRGFSPDLFARMAHAALPEGAGALNTVAPAPVLDCVSWSLRSCLQATSQQRMLWSFDFSQIEARVLAWLAGQQDVLDVFASGDDVYIWAARQFGSSDRQLGKVLILALGFGMGASKLRDTARKAYGVQLTAEQAERFKTEWRQRNPHIVRFWAAMDAAAKAAILRQGHVIPAGGSGVAFTCPGKTLQMRLPSGRVLYYHKPSLNRETGNITYYGAEVGGRWTEQRTWGGKLAENATQACARDVLSEAMLRVWRRRGLAPCMSVHDELVFAVAPGNHDYLRDLMLEPPPWAGGLPLAGEHKMMRRYGVGIQPVAIAKVA